MLISPIDFLIPPIIFLILADIFLDADTAVKLQFILY